jgi:hypothetical protein
MTLRRVRLVTGLVLMAFVTGHMANLMLGMHSLEAMERARPWLMGPWRSGIGIPCSSDLQWSIWCSASGRSRRGARRR